MNVGLGILASDQAVAFLEASIPMSAPDEREEVIEMKKLPGQNVAYEIGKLRSSACPMSSGMGSERSRLASVRSASRS